MSGAELAFGGCCTTEEDSQSNESSRKHDPRIAAGKRRPDHPEEGKKTSKQRRTKSIWTHAQDIELANCYITISTDENSENVQSEDTFYRRIQERYSQRFHHRSLMNLKLRYFLFVPWPTFVWNFSIHAMKTDVLMYEAALAQSTRDIQEGRVSGASLQEGLPVMADALFRKFSEDNKGNQRAFGFSHVLEIFRAHPHLVQ